MPKDTEPKYARGTWSKLYAIIILYELEFGKIWDL